MTCGECRPDWQQPLSDGELTEAILWRQMVLAGYESLATVEQVSDLGLTAMDDRQESLYLLRDMRDALDMMREKRRAPPARKARPKRLEPEKAPVDVPRPKLEAPPGMADDDPLILAGVYAKRR